MVEKGENQEYELVPRGELERLEREVERIKRNPFGDTASSKDLLTALDHLNKNVSKLVHIFESASDEIVRDYKDQANTAKINKVLEQNEKLAQGIVAIANLLKEQRSGATPLQSQEEPAFQATPPSPPQQFSQPQAQFSQQLSQTGASQTGGPAPPPTSSLTPPPTPPPGTFSGTPFPSAQGALTQQPAGLQARKPSTIPLNDVPPPPPR